MLLFLLGAATATARRSWCIGAPLEKTEHIARRHGKEFRGAFRDFTLWVEDGRLRGDASCQRFGELHAEGNDGLWVVEFDDLELMQTERQRMAKVGIDVKAIQNRSILVGGGIDAADTLGYDACGAEKNKRFISVPTSDVRAPRAMPKATKAYYKSLLTSPQPSHLDILDAINETLLVESISHMENYDTRNSYSGANGLDQAVEWAESKFNGYGFDTTRLSFRSDMTPQVMATIPGAVDPSKIVVVGAHFDSRGTQSSSPTQRAPGADDNGSGSASVLELARVVRETGTQFKYTLMLCLFTGEEQGLIGSRALARKMRDDGEDVLAMFNADMIGYGPEGADVVLAYMNRYADPDLTELSREITELYVPEVQTSLTNVCCSDQQSFYENGYSSVGFFETPQSSVVYPQYHRSDDLLENLESRKIYLMTKATLASAIVFAEPLAAGIPEN